MSRVVLTIEYIDGITETIYADSVVEKESCLYYYIRFGVNSGGYYIPYSQIKRWKIEG